MDKKIKIETDKETLDLIRRAVANYLEELEDSNYDVRNVMGYVKLEKIYNKLADLTFDKEWKKMARVNINISDDLELKVREYCKENNITLTVFFNMAIIQYMESNKLKADFTKLFKDMIEKQVKEKLDE